MKPLAYLCILLAAVAALLFGLELAFDLVDDGYVGEATGAAGLPGCGSTDLWVHHGRWLCEPRDHPEPFATTAVEVGPPSPIMLVHVIWDTEQRCIAAVYTTTERPLPLKMDTEVMMLPIGVGYDIPEGMCR